MLGNNWHYGFPPQDPRSSESDIVILQRATNEFFLRWIPEAKSRGQKIIYDIDDNLWEIPSTNPAFRPYNIPLQKQTKKIIQLCDAVTVSTDPLRDYFLNYGFNRNVTTIPNFLHHVHTDLEKTDKVRIAWWGTNCLSKDTEIYTEFGWKLFSDLDKTEKVATLKESTNSYEYHLPTEYSDALFTGKMYECKNEFVDFRVTSNHRMLVSSEMYGKKYTMHMEDLYLNQWTHFYVYDENNCHIIDKKDILVEDVVDEQVYCVTVPNETIYVRRNGKPIWTKNTHAGDWHSELVFALDKIKDKYDNIELVFMGWNPMRGKKERYEFHPFVESENFFDYLKTLKADILVAPLIDCEFNKDKSNIKYLEASACKTASICQDVYPYAKSIKHGETGYLIKNNKDWYHYIEELVLDSELRNSIANNAYSFVNNNFTFANNSQLLLGLYDKVFRSIM